MKAADIRDECRDNLEKFDTSTVGVDGALQLLQYGATMEVAAQLAELNERLCSWEDKNRIPVLGHSD